MNMVVGHSYKNKDQNWKSPFWFFSSLYFKYKWTGFSISRDGIWMWELILSLCCVGNEIFAEGIKQTEFRFFEYPIFIITNNENRIQADIHLIFHGFINQFSYRTCTKRWKNSDRFSESRFWILTEECGIWFYKKLYKIHKSTQMQYFEEEMPWFHDLASE